MRLSVFCVSVRFVRNLSEILKVTVYDTWLIMRYIRK